MSVKISKRGPAVVTLKSGGTLDLWFNKEIRLWTLQQKDSEGNQVGPGHNGEAAYHSDRTDAVNEMRNILSKEG